MWIMVVNEGKVNAQAQSRRHANVHVEILKKIWVVLSDCFWANTSRVSEDKGGRIDSPAAYWVTSCCVSHFVETWSALPRMRPLTA
jgi:hypothetical protein